MHNMHSYCSYCTNRTNVYTGYERTRFVNGYYPYIILATRVVILICIYSQQKYSTSQSMHTKYSALVCIILHTSQYEHYQLEYELYNMRSLYAQRYIYICIYIMHNLLILLASTQYAQQIMRTSYELVQCMHRKHLFFVYTLGRILDPCTTLIS